MSNVIDYKILEDGTISVTTGDLSGTNHVSADKMLKQMFDLVGGPVQSRKLSRLEVGHEVSHALHQHVNGGHTH